VTGYRFIPILSICLLTACGGGNQGNSTPENSGTTTQTISGSLTTAPGGSNAAQSQGSQTVAAGGTATLSWNPPLYNIDGSILMNLAGYHVYYGADAGHLDRFADLSGPSHVVFTVSQLAAGAWHFVIRAYNAAGVEGPMSQMVETTVR
jgi:hypothetical protein